MKKTTWPGNWKISCQRCGFWYPSSEIQKEWTGLLVCGGCWETRHEQTLIQVREETAVPSFVSKDSSPDTFIATCSIVDSSNIADLATADCARASSEDSPYSYDFLLGLVRHGHGDI